MTDFNHEEDVVYGYKDGMALVMDVYTPRDPRVDAGILWVTAGGWRSSHDWRHTLMQRSEGSAADNLARCLLDAGYVVFAVAHSSQPRYSIDDLRPDMPRAVRFVRHNAARFRIDAERLGIIGFSSGGHVSLLTATAPPPPDLEAADPVDRVSSRVQAVTAFFAPTDLLNYGAEGASIQDHLNAYIQAEQGHEYNAIFAFTRFDEQAARFESITDAAAHREILRQNSPITHVDNDTPPVLLFHGDEDGLVPLQQSEVFCSRLQQVGTTHKLVVMPGVGHETLPEPDDGRVDVIDWFGRHLGPERG